MIGPYDEPMGIFEGMFDEDPLIEALERGDDPEDGEDDWEGGRNDRQ